MVNTRTYETDVLVIGGGLAALRAALAAARTGASVTVAVKRKLGRCGSSAVTSGGYAATHPQITPADSWRVHYADTLAGGALINDRALARITCEEAGERLDDLLDVGAQFLREEGGFHLSPSGDHSSARVLVPIHMRGTDMTLPLREAALAAGVHVLEDTYIVELLADDGAVAGAVGLDWERGEVAVIRAKTTIMGTGGAGRLFSVTSNPVDVTGDGFALAYRIGVPLRDMEMIQFYPWRAIHPFRGARVPVQPSTFVVGAKLYNADGERFMARYDPARKESTTRDVAARGIFDQIRLGKAVDDGVILDLSDVSDADFRSTNLKVMERLEPRKINFRDVRFIIAPEAHFVMGGMIIDAFGRTAFERLYACGEAAGGIHGGNRLNSNALPDTQVFGARAGQHAAEVAQRDGWARVDDRIVERWQRGVSDLPTGRRAEVRPTLDALRAEFQKEIWLAVGIVRTGDGLARGQRFVTEMRDRLEGEASETVADFEAATEMRCMCDAAEAMIQAALHRTESRGAHYREDFPERDDARWVRAVVVRRDGDGRVHLRTDAIDTSEDARYLAPATVPAGVQKIEGEFVE